MNRRSPRVVTIGRKPLCGIEGRATVHAVMPISMSAMTTKNAAVGPVHAIHSSPCAPSIACSLRLHAAQGEALGDVVADEIDHHDAGNESDDSGSRQHAPVDAGRTDGAGH